MIRNGKIVADTIKEQLKEEIEQYKNEVGRPPRLVIISVGDDPASKVYVKNKMKAAEEIGIKVSHFVMVEGVEAEYVISIINKFNGCDSVDGIMVQLPLPTHLDERAIINAIDPTKDVDGLTTTNIGRLRSGQPGLRPCTAQGIIDLLDYYNIEMDGKDVTIVGRSNIVGKPLADMMMERGATVTQCHSRTKYMEYHFRGADILVSAIGQPKKFGKDEMTRWHDVIIDVGINHDENGKLCGDFDFDVASIYCNAITPVPGGVGPMTVAELMKNTVECWRKNNGK